MKILIALFVSLSPVLALSDSSSESNQIFAKFLNQASQLHVADRGTLQQNLTALFLPVDGKTLKLENNCVVKEQNQSGDSITYTCTALFTELINGNPEGYLKAEYEAHTLTTYMAPDPKSRKAPLQITLQDEVKIQTPE